MEATHEYKQMKLEQDTTSDYVRNYKSGDSFELWYKVGGGGGHELYISEPVIEFTFVKENEREDREGDFIF